MAQIHLLTNALSNMIAAGEVVERPSSVVKELVENSIDAKATKIDIIVEKAGRESIQVIDNGCGMDFEDAVMAFKRHATSKIANERDLFQISTLGFRGEALPSIAAVSHIELTTSTGKDVGTKVTMGDSQVEKVEHSNARQGTSIKVCELFYNTPARLKHLKSDTTEFANIQEVVSHIALGYPHIIFTLIHDGKEVFKTNGNGNVLEVISSTFGIDTARNMLPAVFADLEFKVSGYTSKIEVTRANRYSIITLLNGRYVRINAVVNALIEAYQTYIPKDRYPVAIFNIEVDPFLVDINVHPSKQIVRLSKENELVRLMKDEIAKILKIDIMPPSIEKKHIEKEIVITPNLDFDAPNFIYEKTEEIPLTLKETSISESETEKVSPSKQRYFRVIGQHHGTYIITEFDDGLYLIDQHAAAERINYEKYGRLVGTNDATISLLLPLIMEMPYKEIINITEKNELLQSLGIYLEMFGTNSIRISEIPIYMQEIDVSVYVHDIFELLSKNISINATDIRQHAIATMACKASIKANHTLNIEIMEDLIKKLFECDNPNTCPHGRPTMIKYSNYELEKFFKRAN